MGEEGSHLGSEMQPKQRRPEQEPDCSFLRGSGSCSSGGLVLLQEAVGFLVLMGRILLTGACLHFLNMDIQNRFAPWVWCEVWQAFSCTDNL